MQADRIEPSLPTVDAPHLLAYFWDVGPTQSGAMGEAPLSYTELLAWQTQAGLQLQPWEVSLLRRLSHDYLMAASAARAADCPAPYLSEESIEANRVAVGRQISMNMRAYFQAASQRREKP